MAEGTGGFWRLVLTVKSGPDAGKSCAVDRDVVTVGKMPDCDLVLTDATVSRRHLRITHQQLAGGPDLASRSGKAGAPVDASRSRPDRWLLVDLGSTNGTFVGGARVHEAEIDAGSVIRAGEVEIAFRPEREELAVESWPEDQLGP